MKKIISYTLFGNDLKYYIGVVKNLELNKLLLPEWEMVIYYHPEITLNDFIKKFELLDIKLIDVSNILIGGKNSKEFPYFWRFLSFLENNITIVRDLDSRFSEREVKYINRWISNNKDYFIIRDHPWHSQVPSGLFGIKGEKIDFKNFLDNFIKNSDLRWGTDQEILEEYMKKIDINKIEYCGFDKPESYIVRDDKDFFIGLQIDENDCPTKPSGEISLKYLNEINL